tara:strand:+ start:83 stop:238 length:156 start_codon:yes stop_codon:yes gene_type:complete
MSLLRKLKDKVAYWFHDMTWGIAFQILLVLLFLLTVIGNGISGGFENSPYP